MEGTDSRCGAEGMGQPMQYRGTRTSQPYPFMKGTTGVLILHLGLEVKIQSYNQYISQFLPLQRKNYAFTCFGHRK